MNAFPEYQQNAGASRNDVMNRRMLDAALLIARVPLGLFFFRAGCLVSLAPKKQMASARSVPSTCAILREKFPWAAP